MAAAVFAKGLEGVAKTLRTLDGSGNPCSNRQAVFNVILTALKKNNMTGMNFHLPGEQYELLVKLFLRARNRLDLDFLRNLHGKLIRGSPLVSQCADSNPELSTNLLVRNILLLCSIEKWEELVSAEVFLDALRVRVAPALSNPTPTTPPPATP